MGNKEIVSCSIATYDLSVACNHFCVGGSPKLEETKWPDDFSVVRYPDYVEQIASITAERDAALARIAELEKAIDAAIEQEKQ